MIKKFCVSNYKNFKDPIALDFSNAGGYQFNQGCISNGLIGKMLIYGKNATGKTNLGRAILDIASPTQGFNDEEDIAFINADSHMKQAQFSYTFQFDEDVIVYDYGKASDGVVLSERCLLNGKEVFLCNYQQHEFSFKGLKLIYAETAVTARFVEAFNEGSKENTQIGRLTFLRWIFSNVAMGNDSVILKLNSFIDKMQYMSNISITGYRSKRMYTRFFELLANSDELKRFEWFMKTMGVDSSYVTQKLPDGGWELYFKHERLIPFYENSSSGTIALMNIYRRFVLQNNFTFIFMDEFDAFYHYEMACKLLQYFQSEFSKCQIVFTTHNTNLMSTRLTRPDCVLILSSGGYLTSLCNATERELREGHNLEKMYISGEFERYE